MCSNKSLSLSDFAHLYLEYLPIFDLTWEWFKMTCSADLWFGFSSIEVVQEGISGLEASRSVDRGQLFEVLYGGKSTPRFSKLQIQDPSSRLEVTNQDDVIPELWKVQNTDMRMISHSPSCVLTDSPILCHADTWAWHETDCPYIQVCCHWQPPSVPCQAWHKTDCPYI